MSFTNFTTGDSPIPSAGPTREPTPHTCICHAGMFEDPSLSGEMQVTWELKDVFCGTEVTITQARVPSVIPAAPCYQGWQESLIQLAQLVDPEIPDRAWPPPLPFSNISRLPRSAAGAPGR